jgi:GNAT superfamily N-acetyltransferase
MVVMNESVVASKSADGACYQIDTDKGRLDIGAIHRFLSQSSHWARGIPLAVVERAIEHSLAFGLYRDGAQIGFARVVTDCATFAYLADVFVVAEERNAGLGQWPVETILAYPPLAGLRRWLLVTTRAESLYRRCGFAELRPDLRYLERFDAGVYT